MSNANESEPENVRNHRMSGAARRLPTHRMLVAIAAAGVGLWLPACGSEVMGEEFEQGSGCSTDVPCGAEMFETVQQCASDGGCDVVSLQRIELSDFSLHGDAACFLEALKTDLPGRYTLTTDDHHGGGSELTQHVFVAQGDGTVVWARSGNLEDAVNEVYEKFYIDPLTCVVDSDAIDVCIGELGEMDELAEHCLWTSRLEELFVSCEPGPGLCQGDA